MRRIPLSHRSHIIGFQSLGTGQAEHESALERDFVTLTSFADVHASLLSQPVTLWYAFDGKLRRYTPDYLVRRKVVRSEFVEVKYQSDLDANADRLKPAFAAAGQWAMANRCVFRVATEHDIRLPLLANAKRLLPLRERSVVPTAREKILAVVAAEGAPTFGEVLSELSGNRSLYVATVWRLLA